MAQQSILRHSICQGLFEGIHLVEPFAGVDAFPEEILVYIGGGGRVWIDSRIAGKDPRKGRARRAFQRNADAWLQDRVAVHDAFSILIESRLVERMNGCANQTTCRIARQLRVGVKRDHIAHLPKQFAVGRGHLKTGVRSAPQQLIELAQLSPLAFPADPFLFSCAPATTTMKKVKRNLRFAAVLSIEFFNTVFRGLENLSILRHSLN